MADADAKIRFAAFAAGMRAEDGTLDRDDLNALCRRAAETLGPDAPLSQALAGMAKQLARAPRDRALMQRLGSDLTRFIQTLNLPTPPDAGRKDIHG